MTPALFCRMAQDMLPLLNAQEGDMSAAFPYFLSKKAPISGAQSLLDYDLAWTVHVDAQAVRFDLSVQVPLTSLCPCSRAISEYGANNQRSHVTVVAGFASVARGANDGLIRAVARQASCGIGGCV